MSAINRWAEQKPAKIAFDSITLASCVEAFHNLLRIYREGLTQTDLPYAPNHDQWISFYTDHKRIWNGLREMALSIGGLFRDLIEFDDRSVALNNQARGFKETASFPPVLWDEIESHFFETRPAFLNSHISRISEAIGAGSQYEIPDSLFERPEISFLLAVSFPCWMIFRRPPVMMLRKARQGNIDDIERILRLDPIALFDRKISSHFHNARFQKNQYNFQRMQKALALTPKLKLTRAKMKCNIAGLISAQSEKLGYRLNEPEIRALFDAIAQDKGIADIDTDLPESPETFSQAILRERKFWQPIFPDKK